MDNLKSIPHTATVVTYAEKPLCPINPMGRKGDRMAGFLTYELSLMTTFPGNISQWHNDHQLVKYSCGDSLGLIPCSLLSPCGAPSSAKI